MAISAEVYEIGNTARIKATVKNFDDVILDPDQSEGIYQITITISRLGTVYVDGETMTRESEGIFYYDWDTSDMDVGQYLVKIRATVDSKSVLNSEYLDLINVE